MAKQPEKTFVYLPVPLQEHITRRAARNERSVSGEFRHLVRLGLEAEGDPVPDQAEGNANDA